VTQTSGMERCSVGSVLMIGKHAVILHLQDALAVVLGWFRQLEVKNYLCVLCPQLENRDYPIFQLY
jgi:hypothetical protein